MSRTHLDFVVRGSSGNDYSVTFARAGNNLTATCTCPAGQAGTHCKHRLDILGGIIDGIVSGNESDVGAITEMLAGTDVETALRELNDAVENEKSAKAIVSRAKKKLARCLGN
ncbi:MAG: hypothetical protein R3D68_07045 [Hyphomicrobiaceae bacterium]